MTKAGPTAAQGLGRRQLLAGFGAAALAMGSPECLFASDAEAAEGESTLTRFLDVSRLLTRRRALDAVLGRRIYEELNRVVPRFDYRIDAMRRFIGAQGIADVETLAAGLAKEDRDLAGLATTMITAWYTGVVGNGPDAKLVAYDNALMFDTVRDAVAIPSYCRGAPNYWTARPPAV